MYPYWIWIIYVCLCVYVCVYLILHPQDANHWHREHQSDGQNNSSRVFF